MWCARNAQRTENSRHLGLGQMLAVAESQRVLARGPCAVHVECVGIREDVLVAIGGLVGRDDALFGSDDLSGGVRKKGKQLAFSGR